MGAQPPFSLLQDRLLAVQATHIVLEGLDAHDAFVPEALAGFEEFPGAP